MNWSPEDLDRCEHGRHSIDPCVSCPGGWSTGNRYLTTPQAEQAAAPDDSPIHVRIGTTLGGVPIYVTPKRSRRSS